MKTGIGSMLMAWALLDKFSFIHTLLIVVGVVLIAESEK